MPRRNTATDHVRDQQPPGSSARLIAAAGPAVVAVLRRPRLWSEGIGLLRRTAAPGWWRTWPPIPAPPADYLQFRLQTNNGSDGANPVVRPHDLVDFLQWCRANRRILGK